MKKSWFEYYKNNQKTNISNLLLHWQYLLNIYFSRPKNILEIGCGPADHSVIIKQLFPFLKISLLDSDKKIIQKIKNKFKLKFHRYYICNVKDEIEVKRNLKKSRFDLIYSQGLMEHFNDKDFAKIILNLLPYSNKTLHSLPSENYPTRDFGNERLRNKKELTKILNSIKGIKFKITKYFPDIGFRTKLVKIRLEKLNIIKKIFFFIFGSCHYVIEINNQDATF